MRSSRWLWPGLLLACAAYCTGQEKIYVVEFTGEPAAASMAGIPAAERARAGERRRGELRVEQRRTLTRLAVRGRLLATTETIANAAIVATTAAEAERIARQPGVNRVEPSVSIRPCVDRAIEVQHVRSAWELAGGPAQAGAGAKVAIVDSGFDLRHTAFQDPDLRAPAGYPKSDSETGLTFTNSKVIVYRNYEKLLDPEASPTYLDEGGHGTNVASIAAGARQATPDGIFAGMAPKAWLGFYKVFTPSRKESESAVYLKALDDAVADGMEVVNLSLGGLNVDYLLGIIDDAERRAAALGVQVVWAAGNAGPARGTVYIRPNLINLVAGAASNSRFFGGRLRLDDGTEYPATTAEPPRTPTDAVTAELRSLAGLDPSGLACDPLPPGSLEGKIGMAWFSDKLGRCSISTRLTNLKNAGAVGAVIVSSAEVPEARGMSAGAIPGMRLSNAHGTTLLERLAKGETLRATLDFAYLPQETEAGRVAGFSSRGPGADFTIKPDLSAVGEYVWMAGAGGRYAVGDGTSYATPMVAGAMAVLKAARPNLTYAQYRSLLVNTARPMDAGVMDAGAGLMDLEAALRGSLAADPISVSFGVARADFSSEREISISNLGGDDTVSLAVEPMGPGPAPAVSPNQFALVAGGRQTVRVRLDARAVPAGEYQGFLIAQGTRAGARLRIPYWFAVSTGRTESLAFTGGTVSAAPGAFLENSLWFRITDRFGIPTTSNVNWRLISGAAIGLGLYNIGARERGMYEFDMRFPPTAGRSVFRFSSDDAAEDIWYTASGAPAERYLNPSWWNADLGAVPLGQFSDKALVIGNLGTSALQVRAFGPPNPTVTVRGAAPPFDIPSGGSVSVVVRYAPTTTAQMSGWLVINSNDPDMPGLGVWVSGRGVTPPDNPVPVLTAISPDNARAGGAAFTLTVDGGSFINSSVVEWNGSARATTYVSASRLTAAIPASDLAQVGSARVTVFNPAPGGGRSAALSFRIDPAPTARIEATPARLDFGAVPAGQSRELTLTISAAGGTAPLQVTAAVSSNPRFTLVSPAVPFTVAAGAVASLVVRFAPTAAGAEAGTLTLTSNAANQPSLAVPLSGTGTAASGALELELKVDDGSFERNVGYTDGPADILFVNRLTPPVSPVKLKRVRIFLPDTDDGLRQGNTMAVLVGLIGSDAVLSATSVRPVKVVVVPRPGQWLEVEVPEQTVPEGTDILVGFNASHMDGPTPAALDTSSDYQRRSFGGVGGGPLEPIGRLSGFDGNLGIRAVVAVGP
jgi:hypothetical protein